MADNFSLLIAWYTRHCNGDWEHQHGFKIGTVDNPGVYLRVDLNNTELSAKRFATTEVDLDSEDVWMYCEKTEDGFFRGWGAPSMIDNVIGVFLEWAADDSTGAIPPSPAPER